MRRRGPARSMARAALGAALLLTSSTLVLAVQYVESTIYDPDDVPDTGDECLIDFIAPQDTPQSRADVGNMRAAFEFALANSVDMQMKVKDACFKHLRHLEVVLFRDDPKVYGGETFSNGIIVLDPGDLDDMPSKMLGAQDDILWFSSWMYLWAMVHEIDHNRTTDMDDHHDPSPVDALLKGVPGPAVEDENKVFADLGVEIMRNNYTILGLDDKLYIDFTVRGRAVTLDITEHVRKRGTQNKLAGPTVFTIGPSLVFFNPGEPCVPGGSSSCYPLIGDNDVDHDGVPDGIDRCIDRSDPQQADHDLDGAGAACDHDDDADGVSRALEAGSASIDHNPSSMPEHWACAADPTVCGSTTDPCTDGIDNDLDNTIDSNDPGCVVPDPSGIEFPVATPDGEAFSHYHRLDHGGVSEKQDALLASATVRFDYNLDGTIDSTQTAAGVVVIQHNPAFDSGGGVRAMQGSLLDLSLRGMDPTLGDFQINTVHGTDHPFELTAKQAGSDFPANGQIDFELTLDTTTFGQLDEVTAGLQSSFVPWWQPFETTWNSFGAPMIFSLDDGTPVVRIIDITLRFERDTDFDGSFDSDDNCPDDPNPGQEDDDSDGHGNVCDCGAMDGMVWSRPPGVDLFFVDINTLILSPDGPSGSQLDVLDVVRSGDPTDFLTGATCVGTNLPPWATGVTDTDGPAAGQTNYYLGQLENGCPGTQGEGPAGFASDGTEHQIRDCD